MASHPSNFHNSVCRDALLASLLDGVRASGNRDIHVKMVPTPRGKRIGPLSVPVEEEVETADAPCANVLFYVSFLCS
jgi:DnaJ family protein C protein 13